VKEALKVGPPVSQDCETEMASEKRSLKSLSWYPSESTLAVEVKDRKAYSDNRSREAGGQDARSSKAKWSGDI